MSSIAFFAFFCFFEYAVDWAAAGKKLVHSPNMERRHGPAAGWMVDVSLIHVFDRNITCVQRQHREPATGPNFEQNSILAPPEPG